MFSKKFFLSVRCVDTYMVVWAFVFGLWRCCSIERFCQSDTDGRVVDWFGSIVLWHKRIYWLIW